MSAPRSGVDNADGRLDGTALPAIARRTPAESAGDISDIGKMLPRDSAGADGDHGRTCRSAQGAAAGRVGGVGRGKRVAREAVAWVNLTTHHPGADTRIGFEDLTGLRLRH